MGESRLDKSDKRRLSPKRNFMENQSVAALRVLIGERHRTMADGLARDVAIVDLDLSPEASLVGAIRALSPGTRIIVLADLASPDSEALVRALAQGAVRAIYKQSSLDQLLEALTRSSGNTPVLAEEATAVLLGAYIDSLTRQAGA
jgi:DNA-binding NarL/FixJ family response regulator